MESGLFLGCKNFPVNLLGKKTTPSAELKNQATKNNSSKERETQINLFWLITNVNEISFNHYNLSHQDLVYQENENHHIFITTEPQLVKVDTINWSNHAVARVRPQFRTRSTQQSQINQMNMILYRTVVAAVFEAFISTFLSLNDGIVASFRLDCFSLDIKMNKNKINHYLLWIASSKHQIK